MTLYLALKMENLSCNEGHYSQKQARKMFACTYSSTVIAVVSAVVVAVEPVSDSTDEQVNALGGPQRDETLH